MSKLKQIIALFLHDVVCHPLIFVTGLFIRGGAAWAWSLHDDVGELATTGEYRASLQVNGPGVMVQQLMDDLTAIGGWDIQGSHLHGDARGCFSAAPNSSTWKEQIRNSVKCTFANCEHIRGMHDLAKHICLMKECPCQGFTPPAQTEETED